MAGIGFQLRKMLAGESFIDHLRAYAYAGVIITGPWLISILSIVGLTALFSRFMPNEDLQLFSTSITYVYAFSLILVGPLQLVLTRFAADQISVESEDEIFPSYVSALVATSLLAAIVAVVFFFRFVPGSLLYHASMCGLMVYVACVFITANYLNVLRDYRAVVRSFFIGYVLSCGAAFLGAYYHSAEAAIAGFAAGHIVLFLLLFRNLAAEIGTRKRISWKVLGHFRLFPSLALCGLLYNLGIWIDKLLFWWFSQNNLEVSGLMMTAPAYDMAIYLSLLSIAPGMAVFFLKLETNFAERFSGFFSTIRNGGALDQIVEAREAIGVSLREGFERLFLVQGVVTALLVIFADRITPLLHIGSVQLGIFRITLFGAFLLVIFLSLLTILFYVDDRKGALLCTAIFVLANAGLSVASLLANEAWYGMGFVVASGLALVVAAFRVNHRIAELEYRVFAAQA